MKILLIDSSSKKIEFGYAIDDDLIIKEELSPDNNADTLTYFLKQCFEKNKISFEDVEVVSLSNGPGSFTGLRIGSAIAKGICFAAGSKLIEISTLDIIANKHKSKNKFFSLIFSNSKTNEFYFCKYQFKGLVLKRILEYSIGKLDSIIEDDTNEFVINEEVNEDIKEEFPSLNFINVSGESSIDSQLGLTLKKISEEKFSNYKTSEPFYMKEFLPK